MAFILGDSGIYGYFLPNVMVLDGTTLILNMRHSVLAPGAVSCLC